MSLLNNFSPSAPCKFISVKASEYFYDFFHICKVQSWLTANSSYLTIQFYLFLTGWHMTCWLVGVLERGGKHIFAKIKSPKQTVFLRMDYPRKNCFKNPKSLLSQHGSANNPVPRHIKTSISSQQWVYFLTAIENTRLYWDIQVEDNHLRKCLSCLQYLGKVTWFHWF